MKTLHTDFKLWVGDDVYYIKDGQIKDTYVYKIVYNFEVCTIEHNNSCKISYILQNGTEIYDKDINTAYFTDKKELIQYLVSQL